MTIYEFEGRRPKVSDSAYIAKSATVIGKVEIGKNCYVAPGARIKGDYGKIIIGNNSNVQENCVVHAQPEERTAIGDWVTIGHGAIIHGATIDDYAVIGMGAIVSDDAEIGRWGVVGEGAVVRNNQKVDEENVVVGIPAKSIKEISESYKEKWKEIKREYASFSQRYKKGLKEID
ncbi:MAG: gamma carbonic anhydrase family protein [Candidatus Thermoplasmatota archaeon]|nr:gamma carbonic anhydrase family protein [Candidatus Thermoplasmatota archaeon]MBS3790220.1 gamma carbonic anhydrase family protein [Candidatus Thermoplasmatota archaeon]